MGKGDDDHRRVSALNTPFTNLLSLYFVRFN